MIKSQDWEKAKWIFNYDGALRDIYIRNVSIETWKILIDHLNTNYQIRFGTSGEIKDDDKIDKQYVIQLLEDETGQLELRTASIVVDDIYINTHFFYSEEIEFDIDPQDINKAENFKSIIYFMDDLSKILNAEVILTGENQVEYPLIKVNNADERIEIINKEN